MKSGKATGPDDIASELWKAKSWDPTLWLSEFFNRVIQERRTPSDWQESTIVPIWKEEGNSAECSNYRPIQLLSYTMKIFERILDNRIREIVEITMNQAEFFKNCGTTVRPVAFYGFQCWPTIQDNERRLTIIYLFNGQQTERIPINYCPQEEEQKTYPTCKTT